MNFPISFLFFVSIYRFLSLLSLFTSLFLFFFFSYSRFLFSRLQSSLLNTLTTHLVEEDEEVSMEATLSSLSSIIKNFVLYQKSKNKSTICKIFVLDFHHIINPIYSNCSFNSNISNLISKFFIQLKRFIRDNRISLNFAMETSNLKLDLLTLTESHQDIVVGIESFASKQHCVPYEFKDFLSFFLIKKLQSIGMLSSYVPRDVRYGIKQDRRKLYIEPLHLPPEESRTFQTTGGCAPGKPVSKSSASSIGASLSANLSISSSSSTQQGKSDSCNDHSDCSCEKKDTSAVTDLSAQLSSSTLSPSKSPQVISNSSPSTPINASSASSSIAATLAAARARRAATKTSSSFASPISINKAPPSNNKADSNQSLDF